ncbi:MAG: M17 family metallopeptidase [Chromatiales bacterium]|nr:M17 family metallopeptidase [Chromatiales bacterium]
MRVIYLTELPVKKRDVAWRVRQARDGRAATRCTASTQLEEQEGRGAPAAAQAHLCGRAARRTGRGRGRRCAQGLAIADGMDLAQGPRQPAGQHLHADAIWPSRRWSSAREFELKVEVLERADMEKLGMGSLLSVAKRLRTSRRKFIVLRVPGRQGRRRASRSCWSARASPSTPAASRSSRRAEMDEMKFDMCGAASVLGTLQGGGAS